MDAAWIGISLKMYFGPARVRAWCARVGVIALAEETVRTERVEVAVFPSFVSVPAALEVLAGAPVTVGAQDLATEDSGAFTGEVSGAELAELGCRYAEVGHAERRRLFGEDEAVVAAKTAAALRHGLTPVLCVGEPTETDPRVAAADVLAQVRSALDPARQAGLGGDCVVAYEPQWAIGQAEPAEAGYVRAVCEQLREQLAGSGPGLRIVYGGSAGPGLLDRLGGSVDGLFLGRFAHDPDALRGVLAEAARLRRSGRPGRPGQPAVATS